MQAELLAVEDPRWACFLRGAPHDFYHLPNYVALCAGQEGGAPAAFWAEEGDSAMLAPLLLRPLPADLDLGSGLRDATAPYGYPAPLLTGPRGGEQLEAFLQAFRDLAAGAGIVSAFFRCHPLLPLPEADLDGLASVRDHGETVFVDLTRPEADLAQQTRTNHRADARRLQGAGYRALVDDWERLPDFVAIYRSTMAFREATDYYRFDAGYFDALRACLGERLHLCTVLAPNRETAAAGLFTCVGGLVQFHLSGTAEAYRKAGPTKLMLLHMRDWAKAGGQRLLHLGGGLGCRQDSLAFFKQGFSRQRAAFRTLRLVAMPDAYRRLTSLRERLQPERAPEPDFFPAYRHP
jgi:hypothetical protein